jgi:hypothetical protein
LEWSFGDGPTVTNAGYQVAHAWGNPGDYAVTLSGFNADHQAGLSTNLTVRVLALSPPTLGVASSANGSLQMLFESQPGVNYSIEYSSNLSPPVVWQTLQNLISTGVVVQVIDGDATNMSRFYRVRAQ